jgi:hypothetical protein
MEQAMSLFSVQRHEEQEPKPWIGAGWKWLRRSLLRIFNREREMVRLRVAMGMMSEARQSDAREYEEMLQANRGLSYVQAIEGWGRDERIIEAARMSTGKGFQGWDTDAKLLAFLYNNKHATPFEMAGLVIEVKAPIFVFREWHRHRTQSYNEMSARYIPLPDENYVPTRRAHRHRARGRPRATGRRRHRSHSTRQGVATGWRSWTRYKRCAGVYERGCASACRRSSRACRCP